MLGTIQHIVGPVPKLPTILGVLKSCTVKSEGRFGPVHVSQCRSYASSYTRGSVTAVLPLFIVSREPWSDPRPRRRCPKRRVGRIAKAGWRHGRELTQQRWWIGSRLGGLVGEVDREGVEARRLGFLVDDIADGAAVEPERVSAVCEGEL